MSKCPNCRKNCIPLWRTFFMPSIAPAFRCPCCGAQVYRVVRLLDGIAYLPLILVSGLVYFGGSKSSQEVWLYYIAGGLAGFALWIPFVRYRVFPEKDPPLHN